MQLSHCHSFTPGFTLVLTDHFLCKYPSTAHSWWLHWWDNGISQRLRGLPRLGVWECMVYVMNNQGVCERICTWVCAGEKLHDQYLVRVMVGTLTIPKVCQEKCNHLPDTEVSFLQNPPIYTLVCCWVPDQTKLLSTPQLTHFSLPGY